MVFMITIMMTITMMSGQEIIGCPASVIVLIQDNINTKKLVPMILLSARFILVFLFISHKYIRFESYAPILRGFADAWCFVGKLCT